MSAETLSYQFRNSQSQEEAVVTYQWQALYFESVFLHEMAEACRKAAVMVSAVTQQEDK
ncbi:hypothetical protein QPN73_001767 [Salmonella enterica]|nr:hypothetical protein [Salmonella enterica]ELS3560319.1 hypothetical protein [Salmonella enterica]